MRALICSYYVPQPDRDSGSRRMSDLIDVLLAEGWRIHFVASNGLGDPREARRLQQRGVAVHDGLNGSMEELLATFRFDIALFAFWPIAELYTPVVRAASPQTRVIVDSLDLHLLRDARRIFLQKNGSGGRRLLDWDYASQMMGELNTYTAADRVLAVSKKEADLINDLVADPGLACCVPDCEAIAPSRVPFSHRKGIVCVASYTHPPNVEAIAWLCEEILPRVPARLRAEHPVYVVGNGLNDTVRAFGRHLPEVKMVGWVPSVVPYFERARISAVPLLHGAGTKRKMLQALTIGTPTVATRIGAEGLDIEHGEHVLVANDAESFASSITRLLEDEPLWEKLCANGQSRIRETHDAAVGRARFLEAIHGTLARDPKQPILPAIGKERHQERVNYQYHQQLMPHIGHAVGEHLPNGARVVVMSEGSRELLRLPGAETSHFLQNDRGEFAPGCPADGADAIRRLEAHRERGAEFLLVPSPAFWWLDHYGELRNFLETRYTKLVEKKDSCVLFALREPPANGNGANGHHAPDVSENNLTAPVETDVKLIAFYLPQFHPIEENNAWWGEGFTEWTNVVKAQPLFDGHNQPQLPADLGFYDLRAPETRRAQAALAREHGIHGFCYYHYWFGGKRLLERPFTEVLASGDPDFPFCLCWANEPWSRRWDGMEHDVLQAQIYSEEDDLAHIHALIPALSDPRAITIEGKPVFMVYQGQKLPEPARTVETWRREAERAGLPGIYLMCVETGWDAGWDATQAGFDAKVLFQPQFSMLRTTPRTEITGKDSLQVYDYAKAWPVLANPEPVGYRRYDTVFPSWDNTARQGEDGTVVHNATPAEYERWLAQTIAKARREPRENCVVFINAWNEWAEGAHLEPCRRHGREFLEATRRALLAVQDPSQPKRRTVRLPRAASKAES